MSPCPACQAPVAAPGDVARCAACGNVFDPLAQLHPAPKPGKPETTPRGLTVAREPGAVVATLVWLEVWQLRKWPAAMVTVLHLVLIAIGIAFSAWGPVALLALAVGVQLFLYQRVLRQRTALRADANGLSIETSGVPRSFPRATLTDLFVVEAAPRALNGTALPPARKRVRGYALCALAPEPVRLIGGLPTLAHAWLLEDAARVALALPSTELKGAIRRP